MPAFSIHVAAVCLRSRARAKTYAYDPYLDPQLIWAGKAEKTALELDTVSHFIPQR